MPKKLTIAAGLLFATALMPVFNALLMLFSGSSEFTYPELVGVSGSQIHALSPELATSIGLVVQTRGLYLLVFALLWAIIALIPFRKGEKWAWLALFGIGSLWLAGYLILVNTGVKAGVYLSTWLMPGFAWLMLWLTGLALAFKQVFGKPKN